MPCEAGSAIRPPSIIVRPMCIRPLRNVPLVNTTARAEKVAPRAVFTPVTAVFFLSPWHSPTPPLSALEKTSSVTESCQSESPGVFSSMERHISENLMRSDCARGLHIAGPFERLSIRNCMAVRSVTIPIWPPRASISLTICPFAMPPTAGLQLI